MELKNFKTQNLNTELLNLTSEYTNNRTWILYRINKNRTLVLLIPNTFEVFKNIWKANEFELCGKTIKIGISSDKIDNWKKIGSHLNIKKRVALVFT